MDKKKYKQITVLLGLFQQNIYTDNNSTHSTSSSFYTSKIFRVLSAVSSIYHSSSKSLPWWVGLLMKCSSWSWSMTLRLIRYALNGQSTLKEQNIDKNNCPRKFVHLRYYLNLFVWVMKTSWLEYVLVVSFISWRFHFQYLPESHFSKISFHWLGTLQAIEGRRPE